MFLLTKIIQLHCVSMVHVKKKKLSFAKMCKNKRTII